MGIEDILFLEIEGVTNTIKSYTRENFIVSYANKLRDLSYPNDRLMINKVTDKLLEWYEESIEDIKNNQYIGNTNEHFKCIKILKNINRLTHE